MYGKNSSIIFQRFISLVIGLCFLGIPFIQISCKEIDKVNIQNDSCPKAYIIQLSSAAAPALPSNYDELSRFNFYGICWNGKVDDNLKFAKQMGYSYVLYQKEMENSSHAKDLYFYLESPEYQVCSSLGVDRSLDSNKAYTESQISTYQNYFALKNNSLKFPENMASGWFSNGKFSVEPDYQQQRVIDYFVSKVKAISLDTERKERNFLFAGIAWDVPQFTGDFYGDGKQVTLAYWNGKDSSALFPGTTHEYRTYSEGKANYFLSIKDALANQYTGRKLCFIFEPYNYYDSWFKGLFKLEYNQQVKLMENTLITQESGVTKWSTGTEFVDDTRAYNGGLLKKDRSGSSTPDNHDLASNKLIAGKAAVNGAWVNWYGRFSGSGDRVPMKNIYEVPSWLQLIRVVANWDNLSGVQLPARSWDGKTYSSTNSHIDDNIIYSRQPETQKLFVVFMNGKGEITLNPGETVVSVKSVDGYFCETTDATANLKISGNKITLK